MSLLLASRGALSEPVPHLAQPAEYLRILGETLPALPPSRCLRKIGGALEAVLDHWEGQPAIRDGMDAGADSGRQARHEQEPTGQAWIQKAKRRIGPRPARPASIEDNGCEAGTDEGEADLPEGL